MLWLIDSTAVRGIFNVGTGNARSFRDLIGAMYAAMGDRPPSNISRCRPRCATSTNTSPRPRREFAPRGLSHGFTPLEAAVTDYVTRYLRSLLKTDTAEHADADFDQHLSALREQTVLCIGDLMLDDFVYGDVSRISPEAPAPIIAVRAMRW